MSTGPCRKDDTEGGHGRAAWAKAPSVLSTDNHCVQITAQYLAGAVSAQHVEDLCAYLSVMESEQVLTADSPPVNVHVHVHEGNISLLVDPEASLIGPLSGSSTPSPSFSLPVY